MTNKNLVFCLEYLQNGFNATKAALTAGYSPKTAYSQGQRLLKNVETRQFLENYRTQLMKSAQLTLDQIIARIDELSQTAKADADKLKALDMLMKHLGGYVTAQDLAANLTEEQREKLLEELLKRVDK